MPFDFNLSRDQEMIRDSVREFAQSVLKPRAAEYDRSREFPWDNWKRCAEMNLTGMMIPEEHGGAGFDCVSYVIAIEELGRPVAGPLTMPQPSFDASSPSRHHPAGQAAALPKVDIGILTIRDDEQRAVIGVFPEQAGTIPGAHREYTLRHADAGRGERYTITVVRQVEQGLGEAQTVARDLIEDLAPRLILVVGIAGGLPSDDVTLGDVVLSSRIHDFTVEARKTGHEATYAATGGPIDRAIANAVAELANREAALGDWTSAIPGDRR